MNPDERFSLRLDPLPPLGSVYFSQAHALRWIHSRRVDPSLLYREILSHALFFEALVISDSYAITNWHFMELLPGGRFADAFPGIDRLIREGAIRIAKRRSASLEEIARGQIGRKTPVMVDGKLTRIDDSFLPHAEALDRLSELNQFRFDTDRIRLKETLVEDVLDIDSVSAAYGLTTPSVRKEIIKVVKSLTSGGPLFAADLFNYPERSRGLLSRYKSQVQKLATSIHSCNFPVTFGLLPLLSPNSDDHVGATVFFERFTPEIALLREKEEVLLEGATDPLKLVPVKGPHDLTLSGVDPILSLRITREFKTLQEARATLLRLYRESTNKPATAPIVLDAEINLERALVDYLGCVAKRYRVTGFPDNLPEGYLKTVAYETSRTKEKAKDAHAVENSVYVGLAALITALVALGILPHAILLATGGMYLSSYFERKRVLRNLDRKRDTIERASRLINLTKSSE